MEGRCEKHPFERMERHCRNCGGEFCADCLVYSYGPKKPPYCVNCALAAAGVRSSAARPQLRSKREIKREMKDAKRQEKLAAKSRVDADVSLLLQAQPVGAPDFGSGDEMRFEFTIDDDGSIVRDAESAPAPEPEPVHAMVPEAETVPASKSIFDY